MEKEKEVSMRNRPLTFDILLPGGSLSQYDVHTQRRLSAMEGQFADQDAYAAQLALDDVVLYEMYEIRRPELAGELLHGLSIVHPGKIGEEYYMTKGHFHVVLETGEIYHCLQGKGAMVMETPEGEWSIEELRPGRVLYVPPRWAHRSVNTGKREDLITLFAYPGHAGHDYRTIEAQGFRKLLVERDGRPVSVDNPRWRAPS